MLRELLGTWQDITAPSAPGNVGGGCLWVAGAMLIVVVVAAVVVNLW